MGGGARNLDTGYPLIGDALLPSLFLWLRLYLTQPNTQGMQQANLSISFISLIDALTAVKNQDRQYVSLLPRRIVDLFRTRRHPFLVHKGDQT